MLMLCTLFVHAQKKKPARPSVFVDKEGVMRWTSDKKEASFFGVNYTAPFAYSYRAHKALHADLEEAIRQDVYHLARLGLDAFRVHVWDNEISDVAGNLLDNDHLRLYDFLLAELKKRNIKTIITPIAFWGNGYPQQDEDVPGFSRYYGRGKLTTNDSAIAAQENYLKQFFRHVNPYTRLAYNDDPDVVAVEINNEPSHSGPKRGVTDYINRLAAAIRSTGWSKPVFYNISQGPYYADAVAASRVDGFSFQWYPSGLVSGNILEGNYLPHVDKYTIPFDTIPAFARKALMVYEFDAADILDSDMYPAMARSFREAGFQWATQFAYDPLALAYANTEYQTHYLNLAYTPSKAVSLLVASRVFHRMPRHKDYGRYPADSVFDVFRVSYKEALSEMNTPEEFIYSNSTDAHPADAAKLAHIAGVGSSVVVQYDGSGAYFLDKLEDGVWRLELMPDAIHVRDPFERASPAKVVTRIEWNRDHMRIDLASLGPDFSVKGLNEGNEYSATSERGAFGISPGTYLLERSGKKFSGGVKNVGPLGLHEFVAPAPTSTELMVVHSPFAEVSAGKAFTISAKVAGIDTGRVSLQIARMGGRYRTIGMKRNGASRFTAEVPADLVTGGMLNYRIIARCGDSVSVFPGNHKGNPFAWDNYNDDTWSTFVASADGELSIFDPTTDRALRTYPSFRRGFQTSYVTGKRPGQLILRMTASRVRGSSLMGFQYAFVDKLMGRKGEMGTFDKVVVRARSTTEMPEQAKVALVFSSGGARAATVTLTEEFREIAIPLSSFRPDSALLMPRPYPGFLPLFFKASSTGRPADLSEAQRIQVTLDPGTSASESDKQHGMEVERIWLEKGTKAAGSLTEGQ